MSHASQPGTVAATEIGFVIVSRGCKIEFLSPTCVAKVGFRCRVCVGTCRTRLDNPDISFFLKGGAMLNRVSSLFFVGVFLSAAVVIFPAPLAAQCATTGSAGPFNTACPQCGNGSCTGEARVISQYPVCASGPTGKETCTPSQSHFVLAGTIRPCQENVSWWGVTICFGAGCGAGLAGCFVASVPCLGAAGVGYFVCLASCCGLVGAGGYVACCTASCYCVDSCDPGAEQPYYVPQPILSGADCPRS